MEMGILMDFTTIEAEYEAELVSFFKTYFDNEGETLSFIQWIYKYDWNNRIPRQMINQIYHFVTLASRIDQIWPERDGLRLLFIKTCLEALFHLSDYKDRKKQQFYDVFSECFSEKGSEWILSHFKLIYFTDTINGISVDAHYTLTMPDFLRIIKIVRDNVVHEGDYWGIQLFAYGDDPDIKWCTDFLTREKFLAKGSLPHAKVKTDYHFETTLYFEEFKFYFTEACINYVKAYINGLSQTN